jgi:hypothetical protein
MTSSKLTDQQWFDRVIKISEKAARAATASPAPIDLEDILLGCFRELNLLVTLRDNAEELLNENSTTPLESLFALLRRCTSNGKILCELLVSTSVMVAALSDFTRTAELLCKYDVAEPCLIVLRKYEAHVKARSIALRYLVGVVNQLRSGSDLIAVSGDRISCGTAVQSVIHLMLKNGAHSVLQYQLVKYHSSTPTDQEAVWMYQVLAFILSNTSASSAAEFSRGIEIRVLELLMAALPADLNSATESAPAVGLLAG